jgi:hypothetical protein
MVGRVLIRLLLPSFVPSPSFHHLFTDGSLQSMSSAFPLKKKKKNRGDGKDLTWEKKISFYFSCKKKGEKKNNKTKNSNRLDDVDGMSGPGRILFTYRATEQTTWHSKFSFNFLSSNFSFPLAMDYTTTSIVYVYIYFPSSELKYLNAAFPVAPK